MDYSLFLLANFLVFGLMTLSHIFKNSGLGGGLGAISLMLCVLMAISFGGGETIDRMSLINQVPTYTTMDFGGITNDHLVLIYLIIGLICFFIHVDRYI